MENYSTSKTASGNQMALFEIGSETFGINIATIKEIVRVPDLTTVPNAPNYLKGLTNLRNRVLPVLDTRIRLNLPKTEITESSRILVLDINSSSTGIMVDKVKGVFSIEEMTVEQPPEIVASGIDRKFIKSVIKSGDGKKVIMEFDVNVLCAINMELSQQQKKQQTTIDEEKKEDIVKIEEIQMVTFMISSEEYAFPIHIVSEVLRVGNITKVPNAPEYVTGILNVRNSILPIIDNRKLFGLKSISEELLAEFNTIYNNGKQWFEELKHAIDNDHAFKQNLDVTKSRLGKWIEHFRTVSKEISEVIQELRYINIRLFENAKKTYEFSKKSNRENSRKMFVEQVQTVFEQLTGKFQELKEAVAKGIVEDQRIMVIEINNYPIGLMVDRVQQVLRVPKNIMEAPPAILSTGRSKAMKNIVKFNNGERIIVLIDETQMIANDKMNEINNLNSNLVDKQSRNKDMTSGDEVQLVTFNLDNEQYAISIEEVREINRIDSITTVPQAPEFIEGVMNLRGNVIPVINMRKRFGLMNKNFDNATKVIIVNIMNRLTGLIVDSVSEVLRISKSKIEPALSIMQTNVNMEFLKGICKHDKTKKMLLLISVDKILSTDQKKQLAGSANEKNEAEIEQEMFVENDVKINNTENLNDSGDNKPKLKKSR